MTVSDALGDAADSLRLAGVPEPEQDAELLLRHVLRWDRATVLARGKQQLDAHTLRQLSALVAERGLRVPLQHLVGRVEFWRREFLVSPAALIPRPETELIVEHGLRLLSGCRSPVVVDVGTGTGCIGLSFAAEREDAQVHALDVSAEALALARENARRLGLAERVVFAQGDLLLPAARLAGQVDLIASNPPYLDASELPQLAPEVRDHEPHVALLPPDGDRYSIYRRLAPEALPLLREGGRLLLEIGLGMEPEVLSIGERAGLAIERVVPDLQGIPRLVIMARGGRG